MSKTGGKSPAANLGVNSTKTDYALDAPLLLTEIPPAPEDLNEEGCMWWKYYCGIFVKNNIMSRMFITSFHNLCIMHMVRKGIMDELSDSEDGVMLEEWYVNKDKEAVKRRKLNPLVKDLDRCVLSMDRLLASLGMTLYTAKIHNIDSTGHKSRSRKIVPPGSSLAIPRKSE